MSWSSVETHTTKQLNKATKSMSMKWINDDIFSSRMKVPLALETLPIYVLRKSSNNILAHMIALSHTSWILFWSRAETQLQDTWMTIYTDMLYTLGKSIFSIRTKLWNDLPVSCREKTLLCMCYQSHRQQKRLEIVGAHDYNHIASREVWGHTLHPPPPWK